MTFRPSYRLVFPTAYLAITPFYYANLIFLESLKAYFSLEEIFSHESSPHSGLHRDTTRTPVVYKGDLASVSAIASSLLSLSIRHPHL